MDVVVLNALDDNFMYLLIDRASNTCAAIDPADPQKLYDYVQNHNLIVKYILTTHHHWDHAGGNKKLVSLLNTDVKVIGGDDRVESINKKVFHGDKLNLGNIEIECLHTPCHTTGHICYFVTCGSDKSQDPLVFTGDTLFIAGCGRFFEGTPEQMLHALVDVLGQLPPSTRVYCGHEYTVKNLKFSLTIEPNNANIKEKLIWAQNQIDSGGRTVPSTIAEELLTNPFMRVNDRNVCNKFPDTSAVAVMRDLRKMKDNF